MNAVEDPNHGGKCGFMDTSLYIYCPGLDFSHEVQRFPGIFTEINPKKGILSSQLALDFNTVTRNYFVVAEMELVILSLKTTAPFLHLPKHILGAFLCGIK